MKKTIFFIFFMFYTILSPNEIKKDIDISNMPLYDVVGILSRESGKNIIASKEAKDIIIDAYFEQGDNIDTILYVLADAYNLSMNKNSNSTILALKNENKESRGKLIIEVKNSITNEPLANVRLNLKDSTIIQGFSSKDGFIIIDNIPKSVYIANFSKNGFHSKSEIININKSILSYEMFLEPLYFEEKENFLSENSSFYEDSGKIFYTENFTLYNVSAEEIKNILIESFGTNIKVSSLSKINKIIVVAERDVLESAKKIIKDLDKNPRQVKITSEILDISNNLFEELGFDWVYSENNNPNKGPNTLKANILSSATNVATGNVFGSKIAVLRQFNSKSDVLNVGINLLEATNDLVISSVPTILIASGEEGEFKVTEEVIVGEKRERNSKTDENNKTYITEPIFKEAGLILKVKPFIKENNEITLDISIELSNFKFKKNLLNVDEINSGTYNSEGGSKVGRSLSTKVKVKNGDTILLGGLKKSIKQAMESKVPILGDIPIISFFFKNIAKKSENSDMYIKLKVEIEE